MRPTSARAASRRGTRARSWPGGGPTISRGPSIHSGVFELLYETAEAEGIPVAVEVSRGTTSTDADAVYLSRHGVATGLVSVPLRYMHSPVETADPEDIERAVQLVVAARPQARARTELHWLGWTRE